MAPGSLTRRVTLAGPWLVAALCVDSDANAADQPVTLFARVFGAAETVEVDTPAGTASVGRLQRVSNYRTIFGVRGSESVGEQYEAVWQLSGGFPVDNSTPTSFQTRDSRVGFAGPAGTLFMGAWQTPYILSVVRLDPYSLTTADLGGIIGNGIPAITGNLDNTVSFLRRQSNSVHYWSPTWNGFAMRAAYGVNEERTASRNPWLASFSASWESGNWYLAGAYDAHNDYQGPGTRDQGAIVSASCTIAGARLGIAFERLRYETATGKVRRDAWFASWVQPVGVGSLNFTYSNAANGAGNATELVGGVRAGSDTGAWHGTAGYEYNFSKRTRILVFVSRLDNDRRAAYEFGSNSPGRIAGARATVASFGIRYDF